MEYTLLGQLRRCGEQETPRVPCWWACELTWPLWKSVEAPQKTETRPTTIWRAVSKGSEGSTAERFLQRDAKRGTTPNETGARCPAADGRNVGCALWSATQPGEERLSLAMWLWACTTTGQPGRHLCYVKYHMISFIEKNSEVVTPRMVRNG